MDQITSRSVEIVKKVLSTDDNTSCELGETGRSLAEEIVKPAVVRPEDSWKDFVRRIEQRRGLSLVALRHRYLRIAAAVLVLVALPIAAYFAYRSYETPVYSFGSEETGVEMPTKLLAMMDTNSSLPDGTRFWMDASSRVKVFGDLAKDSIRQVHAEGDVYFDVAHDALRPFMVYTSRCVITVLGTKFHLHDVVSEPYLSLTLFEGCIKVTGENLNYTMKPGEEVRINHQTGRLQLIDHNSEEPADAPEGTIRGELKGLTDDRLAVSIVDRDFRGATTDTIDVKKGRFELKMKYSSVRLVSIATLRSSSATSQLPQQVSFYYVPGEKVTLKGSLSQPVLSGGTLSEQQNEVFSNVQQPARNEYERLFKRHSGGGDAIRSDDHADYERWMEYQESLALTFIKQHPDWEASAGLLYDLPTPKTEEALALLTDRVKAGVMRPLVAVKEKAVKRHRQKMLAEKQTQKGEVAPDFELRDMDGKVHRLSDMRGKYVVLDFWASWCVPCRTGMPEMKRFYEAHKDKMTILGIATWDVEEGWRRALAELQLPWANVFAYKNTPSDVPARYAVKGLPTKFLISPRGEIMLRYEGEDEEFYEKVNRLMK